MNIFANYCIASTALVGKSLGEGKYENAKVLAYCTIVVGVISGGAVISIVLIFHYFIFRFYTNNEQVIETLNTFLIIIFIQTFFDHIQGSIKGVLRALGKQQTASKILMISYWVIGGISFYIFGFYFELRLQGIWIGFAFATMICTIAYLSIVLSVDWKKEWEIAFKRIEDDLH